MYVRACMCVCEGVYVCVYAGVCVEREGGESLWGIVGYV